MSKRSAFFIDGMIYTIRSNQCLTIANIKWLDLRALALHYSRPPFEEIASIRYFSAFADWRPDSAARHRIYVGVLKSVGVETVLGRFQEKQRVCRAQGGCGKMFAIHEEKMTDVNIAVSIVESCISDQFDMIYLVSGDNDLVPALEAVKRLSSSTGITVILPIRAKAKMLKSICHQNGFGVVSMKESALASAQFPDEVIADGKTYRRPPTWR